MAFLRSIRSLGDDLEVAGRRVRMRPPVAADYAAWARLRAQSRAFLKPWEPTWPSDDLSRRAYRARLRRYARDRRADALYPLFVFRRADDCLIGGITLSNVRRGVAQTATIGYWIGQPYANQGYMSDAVDAVVDHAFEELALHRLEAACLPTNEPSIRLLKRCGFIREGYARRYLKIDGAWADHLLFAILAGDRRALRS